VQEVIERSKRRKANLTGLPASLSATACLLSASAYSITYLTTSLRQWWSAILHPLVTKTDYATTCTTLLCWCSHAKLLAKTSSLSIPTTSVLTVIHGLSTYDVITTDLGHAITLIADAAYATAVLIAAKIRSLKTEISLIELKSIFNCIYLSNF